ncbi:hypothetical protein ACQPZ8_01420 [Actinomadura nitritigenes]|uniref:hypothetical protein n=1 Tax=Actinomadura nitritigenes TaxID=134602 RepID=UPI003D8F120B
MRLTDRVEQVVTSAIETNRALVGAEVDHQVQIVHHQTGAHATPLLWISLSVQSLALGEWLFHDPITTADLHPDAEQLTAVIVKALRNLAGARAQQATVPPAPMRQPGGGRLPNRLPLPVL